MANNSAYSNTVTKFTLGSLDATDLEIDAQYNPHELQIDQQLSWSANGSTSRDKKVEALEQTKLQPETMKVDLFFDGAEGMGTLTDGDGETVFSAIAKLRRMASPENLIKNKSDARRAHFCVATWGSPTRGMPRFECVIESISVKYTQFASDGTVLRATVTLGLKAARRLNESDANNDTSARLARSDARRAAAQARHAARSDSEKERFDETRRREGAARLQRAGFEAE